MSAALEVLRVFLKLGLVSFGGPVAHIGYFREEFVVRRRWIDDTAFNDLVALCQFLPGPASSQLGFSIGLSRAGYWGGAAAWVGFTLPSAAVMVLAGFGAQAARSSPALGLLRGMKLVAVAVVAHAVMGMARTLCPDRQRAGLGAFAALIMLTMGSAGAQIGVLILCGAAGYWLCRPAASDAPAVMSHPAVTAVSRRAGVSALLLFAVLLFSLPFLRGLGSWHQAELFDAFYRTGALVFGGGHVVLPLLHDAFVPERISDDLFLAGYGAAQAIPGPLFTFAAYLGAVIAPAPHRLGGACLGLAGIFLPGILILLGCLPFWETLRRRAPAQAVMRGINAAVVGLLGAALYTSIWASSVKNAADVGVALVGYLMLAVWRAPPLAVVILGAFAGLVFSRQL